VEGLVAAPKVYRFAELTRLPVARVRHTFWCVTGWSVRDVLWEGVLVSSLLADLELLDGAKAVVFFSADGTYVDSLTLAEVYASGTLLAWKMDGAPLSALHGGPVRLVVPKMYGYKSVKWVERIALAEFPPVGTWEAYGYPAAAWVEEDASARGSRSG
jgi:DMSO/TMAO reductase YedYZ molybdopterin-dependent catalytic subunit